jgi:hypothetical protein
MDWLEIFLPSAIAALQKAIKNPKSKAARKLHDKIVLPRDACDQFLSVFDERRRHGIRSILCPYSICPGVGGAGDDQVGVEVVEPLKLRDLEFAKSISLTEGPT